MSVGGRVTVAWISCVGEKGGAETLMLECLRLLDRNRFRPIVIQLRPGPLQAMVEALDVPVVVFPEHRMRQVHRVAGTVAALVRLAWRERIRIFHSNGFRAHVYGGCAALLAGCAEVWTTHTAEEPGGSTRMILGIPTRAVLANCPRTADWFRKQLLPTHLVWPGVDVDALLQRAEPVSREDLARRHGLPVDRPWVVVAARLQRFKGQHLFLKALARTGSTSPAHGVVVGGSLFGQENEYQRELREQVSALGLEGRVTLTGYVRDADLAALLREATLVVHPALEEDFGLSVAEAQALEVPVVAFASVGPAAILEQGRTGWLVPVGDVDGLADRIRWILENPVEAKAMGSRGSERVSREFSSGEHARRTERIYQSVLDPGTTNG
jgi:glycosyltransferase involved in cell wall biosynthesis